MARLNPDGRFFNPNIPESGGNNEVDISQTEQYIYNSKNSIDDLKKDLEGLFKDLSVMLSSLKEDFKKAEYISRGSGDAKGRGRTSSNREVLAQLQNMVDEREAIIKELTDIVKDANKNGTEVRLGDTNILDILRKTKSLVKTTDLKELNLGPLGKTMSKTSNDMYNKTNLFRHNYFGRFDNNSGSIVPAYIYGKEVPTKYADTDGIHKQRGETPIGPKKSKKTLSMEDELKEYIQLAQKMRAENNGELTDEFKAEIEALKSKYYGEEVKASFTRQFYETQGELGLSYKNELHSPRKNGKPTKERVLTFINKFIAGTYDGKGNRKLKADSADVVKEIKEEVVEQIAEEAVEEIVDDKKDIAKAFVEEVTSGSPTSVFSSDLDRNMDAIFDELHHNYVEPPVEPPVVEPPTFAPDVYTIPPSPYARGINNTMSDIYGKLNPPMSTGLGVQYGAPPQSYFGAGKYIPLSGHKNQTKTVNRFIKNSGRKYDNLNPPIKSWVRPPYTPYNTTNQFDATMQSYASIGASRYSQYAPSAPNSLYPTISNLDILPQGVTEDIIDNFIKNAGKRYDKLVRGTKPKSWINPGNLPLSDADITKEQAKRDKLLTSIIGTFGKAVSAFVAGVGAMIGGTVEGAGALLSNTSIAPSSIIGATGGMLSSVGGGVAGGIGGTIKMGGVIGGAVGTAVGGPVVGALITTIVSSIGDIVSAIGKVGGALMKTITGFMTASLKLFRKIAETSPIIRAINDLFQLAFTMVFLPMFTKLGTELLPQVLSLVNKAVEYGQKTKDILINVFDTDEFNSFVDEVTSVVTKLIDDYLPWFVTNLPDIGKLVTSFLTIFSENESTIKSIFDKSLSMFDDYLNDGGLISSILNIVSELLTIFGSDTFREALKAVTVLTGAALSILPTSFNEVPKWNVNGFPWLAPLVTAAYNSLSTVTFAEGGIIQGSPGGSLVTVGEGGQSEAIIPLDKWRDMTSSNGGVTIVFNGDVYGMNDFEKKVKQVVNNSTTRGYYR